MPIVIETETKDARSQITKILKLLCTEDMSEEEFLSIKRRWLNERYMFGGFQYAIGELQEFWKKNETGLKSCRLFTYKGVELILKKLGENKRGFFYKGGDIDISFTEKEIDSIRRRKIGENTGGQEQ